MAVTIDPASLANFFFVYPLQWWYYAVGVGVIAAVRFIQSNLRKKVMPDASKNSPLKTAQEYGEREDDEARERTRVNVDSQSRHRDAVLETVIRRPRLPNVEVQGNGSAIDQATEYMIASAMVNSAKYVRFRNIKIPTKFGELVFENEEARGKTKTESPIEEIPEIPEEDQTEGNQ